MEARGDMQMNNPNTQLCFTFDWNQQTAEGFRVYRGPIMATARTSLAL